MTTTSASYPPARLCHLRKTPDFVEYGFNLHTEKNNNKFVHNVDDDSPASIAGLKMYDRIIEVNGTNISHENHIQVVERVKSRDNECSLLVVCKEADAGLNTANLTVNSQDACVLHLPVNYTDDKANTNDDEDVDPNPPRLCELRLYEYKEYGFVLHWDQDREGQYIKEIDDDSPATASGLRKDDKVIEVNGNSIEGKSHNDVIAMMKEKPGVVTLLVVDTKSERVYRKQSIAISSTLQNIVHMPPATKDDTVHSEEQEDEDVVVVPATTIEVNNNEEETSKEEEKKEEEDEVKEEEKVVESEAVIIESEVVEVESEAVKAESPTEEKEQFDIPIIVKGVVTTADLAEEEEKKEIEQEEEVKVEEEEEVKVEDEVQRVIPIVNVESVDEVDDGVKTPELEEVAAEVTAKVTSDAVEQISQENSDSCKDQETGEAVPCPSSECNGSTPVEDEVRETEEVEEVKEEVVETNGVEEEDQTVDDSSIEPVKRTVSRYDSTPTSPGSFSMSRTSAPVPVEDAEPAIFSMSVAEARKKLVGAKQAKDVRHLNLTPTAKCELMNKL